MPIVNGKYVAPTWANDAPPAIDQTELQAISDTIEGMTPGGGSDGKRYARIVIGTSTNGWNPADCDYLCDGVDDQVEINQAIASMPSGGGEIVLLDGDYNLSSYIDTFQYITISGGNTNSVSLKRMTTNGFGDQKSLLQISNGSAIKNITYYGNSGIFQGQTPNLFEVLVGGGGSIKNVNFLNCVSNAIYAEPLSNFYPTIISECNFSSIKESCVYCDYGGELIFKDCCVLGPSQTIISAYGQTHTGAPIQSPLSIKMSNVTNVPSTYGDIILNGTGFSTITNCICHSIQLIDTVPSGGVSVERGRHILLGNQISPSVPSDPSIVFGSGVNNCLAIGNIFTFGSMTGSIQDNGENNIVFNGGASGQITLSSSGWSGNSQTVSATGVTATNTVTIGPAPSSMNAAMQAGVYCSAQGQGTLTFTCSSVPSSSLTYNYTTQGVG